jgi:hypothetical protein
MKKITDAPPLIDFKMNLNKIKWGKIFFSYLSIAEAVKKRSKETLQKTFPLFKAQGHFAFYNSPQVKMHFVGFVT